VAPTTPATPQGCPVGYTARSGDVCSVPRGSMSYSTASTNCLNVKGFPDASNLLSGDTYKCNINLPSIVQKPKTWIRNSALDSNIAGYAGTSFTFLGAKDVTVTNGTPQEKACNDGSYIKTIKEAKANLNTYPSALGLECTDGTWISVGDGNGNYTNGTTSFSDANGLSSLQVNIDDDGSITGINGNTRIGSKATSIACKNNAKMMGVKTTSYYNDRSRSTKFSSMQLLCGEQR
jgi:hypothetical protein